MGNKNKQRQYEAQAKTAEAERLKLATQLQEGTPESKAYSARIGERRKAIDTGNIGGAVDFVGNSANQAIMNRKREAVWNAQPTGIQAIGNRYADGKTIGLQTAQLKADQARASSAQLEGDWRGYINETNDMERGVISRGDNISMNLMGAADSRSSRYDEIARQIAAQRMNMWAGIAGGLIGGTSSVLSAGMTPGSI
jgi:hypothetical protein